MQPLFVDRLNLSVRDLPVVVVVVLLVLVLVRVVVVVVSIRAFLLYVRGGRIRIGGNQFCVATSSTVYTRWKKVVSRVLPPLSVVISVGAAVIDS